MDNVEQLVQKQLFEMQDLGYKDFQSKLMPTIEPDRVIGVRSPALRKFAKQFAKTPEAAEFIKILPHRYYEENNLHAFIIETIKDFDQAIEAVEAFLPYVDNWATCDSMSPKVFGKHLPEIFKKAEEWMQAGDTYTVRYGIEMLMSYFLDDAFDIRAHELVAAVQSEEYYVNMMIAWYFATALAKQYDATIPYIENKRLADWTHNKAIQKSIESYRITDEQKTYLRSLKVKRK
jgi:3-methyladenine DNA glycosylase AlkD